MAPSEHKQLSKLMSLILRHEPQQFGLMLDANGFVPLEKMLLAVQSKQRWQSASEAQIRQVVRESDKQRYEIVDEADGAKIRALYGHSVEGAVFYEPIVPPEILFHGTSRRAIEAIQREGLKSMKRQYVHLAIEPAQAQSVGSRHDRPARHAGHSRRRSRCHRCEVLSRRSPPLSGRCRAATVHRLLVAPSRLFLGAGIVRLVHRPAWALATKYFIHAHRGMQGHALHRFGRKRGAMRRNDDIVQCQERVMRRGRFLLEDIQSGAGDAFGLQCFDKCVLVHNIAACRVQKVSCGFHSSQFSTPQEVSC